ncbi:MAG TPA: cellulosome anchor protein, partial [Bacillota bacterium]|nr:cellulosome anchor protein [Bacillota bacterium]
MRLRNAICYVAALLVLTSTIAFGENQDLLFLENKYVKIFINNSKDETGRFAMDVSAGDPNRADDDNRPLIYGHPKPWTSYTTIRINGQNYVYGKATTKRPGAKLPGGEIIAAPQVENKRITMTCKYGAITVEQILEITHSPSTGALDTARIRYVIHNTGDSAAEVGLRTVFDTLVGANDGAPFRVGQREITEETLLETKDFPDFWQAFDLLDKPSVIAQGTLKGGDVTSPDQLIFTNWGKAADHPWEIPVQPGTKFIRVGEDELDSVVAMLWMPRTIQPKGTQVITVYYGLGGVTFSPGNTFLGISAPADVQHLGEDTRNYTVILYMEHRGEAKAKNVTVNLDLPAGLNLVTGEPQIGIAELTPGVTKQLAWEIKPDGMYYGDSSFQIRVAGEGLESNQVTRRINISGPIALGATLALPKLKVVDNQWEPNPFTVKLTLKNL